MKSMDQTTGRHNTCAPMVIFNSARLVRKGEKLEHYQPEAADTGGSGSGNSRHEAAGQLTPKMA